MPMTATELKDLFITKLADVESVVTEPKYLQKISEAIDAFVAANAGVGSGGSKIFSGEGVPPGDLTNSEIGDFYFDISNGDYYKKTDATTWTFQANLRGPQGIQGLPGTPGADGANGAPGAAATIAVGTVTTGAAGSPATVNNSGTSSAAILDFSIPKGDKGDPGNQGIQGEPGTPGTPGAPGETGPQGIADASSPVGAVVIWPLAVLPVDGNWLWYQGQSLSKTTYADLYALFGDAHKIGGDPADEFRLPDPRGRAIVAAGQGEGLTNRVLNTCFGAESVTVSVPGHYHGKGSFSIGAGGTHSHICGAPNADHPWGTAWGGQSATYPGEVFGFSPSEVNSYNAYGGDILRAHNAAHSHGNSEMNGYIGLTTGSNGDAAFNATAAPIIQPSIAQNLIIRWRAVEVELAGSEILTGPSVPDPALGKDKDVYIVESTDDLYKKEIGVWVQKANIRGAQGPTGIGVVVGAIFPWIGGYFTDASNGGFTNVLGNTIVDVNALLNPDGLYVCDGSELNDADSPIFNGAGRYLPNLTDSRFLMGSAGAGVTGGSNSSAHTHSVPAHYHGKGTIAATSWGMNQNASHVHEMYVCANAGSGGPGVRFDYNADGTGGNAYPQGINGGVTNTDHNHTIPNVNFTGLVGATSGVNGDAAMTSGEASITENRPQYLSCFYIMRIK